MSSTALISSYNNLTYQHTLFMWVFLKNKRIFAIWDSSFIFIPKQIGGNLYVQQNLQVPKTEVLHLTRLFWGWVFPYISRIHTAYIGKDSSILGTWNAWWHCFVDTRTLKACSQTVDCYDKLSEAVESCRVNLDKYIPKVELRHIKKIG